MLFPLTSTQRSSIAPSQQKLKGNAPILQSILPSLAVFPHQTLNLLLFTLSFFCMSPPPSLLHLTLVTAVLHIHRFSDLSSVPDHLVVHLFQKTLAAGKLTDYVLRLFLATGNDEVLQLVKAWRIRPVIKPILPTRCSDKEF